MVGIYERELCIIWLTKGLALPHDEVNNSEFYKHIETGLPEPRRMKQLLTWCGARALGEKPSFASEDGHAKLAGMEEVTNEREK
jgi:hypothetical protein